MRELDISLKFLRYERTSTRTPRAPHTHAHSTHPLRTKQEGQAKDAAESRASAAAAARLRADLEAQVALRAAAASAERAADEAFAREEAARRAEWERAEAVRAGQRAEAVRRLKADREAQLAERDARKRAVSFHEGGFGSIYGLGV